MNLKMLTLIIFTFLFFSIKVSASPFLNQHLVNHKESKAIPNSNLTVSKTLVRLNSSPNRYEAKTNANSMPLSLKADFWFAMFAIGSLASMRLIKPYKV